MLRFLLTMVVLLGSSGLAAAIEFEARTWTNDQGQTIQATLTGMSRTVAFLDEDGKRINAPIDRLSEADQAYLDAARRLRRWRQWMTPSGSPARCRLQAVSPNGVKLEHEGAVHEVAFSRLADEDRALLSAVFANLDLDGIGPEELPALSRQQRTWTNNDGKAIAAELRAVEGDTVVLYFNHREWRVPLDSLSDADQRFVSQATAGNGSQPSDPLEPPADRGAGDLLVGRPTPPTRTPPAGPPIAHNPGAEAARKHAEEARRRAEEQRLRFEERAREMRERSARSHVETEVVSSSRPSRPSPPARDVSRDPTPTPPSSVPPLQLVNEYECFSCNKTWQSKREYHAGDKCPHCGVTFDQMTGEDGEIVEETSRGKARRYGRIVKLVVFLVIGIAGFIGRTMKS